MEEETTSLSSRKIKGNHARVYTFQDLIDWGCFDNYKVHYYKDVKREGERREIPIFKVKQIVYEYFKTKILESLYKNLPVKTVLGVFLWTRSEARTNEQIIIGKNDKVHVINKRDHYKRSLALHPYIGLSKHVRVFFERVMRTEIKQFLDLGLDIKLNHYNDEFKACKHPKNFFPGGRFDSRTPPEERTTYIPKFGSRSSKKAKYDRNI